MILRIATRQSPLALWQAHAVQKALLAIHPSLQIEMLPLSTQGDQLQNASLAKIGGKGLFTEALETALLTQTADIAVHSLKDMPVCATPGLQLAVYCEREDPRDAFVSPQYASLAEMPPQATVGTSSSRRACLLRHQYPNLVVLPLRGNVGTRLKKLEAGQYDAIILAVAGLKRLGESAKIRAYLAADSWIPAVGQGVIAIECRENDAQVSALLQPLDHPLTRQCALAERAFNATLNGGCQLPIAAHAVCHDHQMHLSGFVANPNKNESLRAELTGSMNKAEALGKTLAETLLAKGAAGMLEH